MHNQKNQGHVAVPAGIGAYLIASHTQTAFPFLEKLLYSPAFCRYSNHLLKGYIYRRIGEGIPYLSVCIFSDKKPALLSGQISPLIYNPKAGYLGCYGAPGPLTYSYRLPGQGRVTCNI